MKISDLMQSSDFKDLQVWQKSILLAKEVYRLDKFLPKDETFALSDQMRRSAISISSNIAEGNGRNSEKDFIRFLLFARGSLCELESQIYVGKEIGYFSDAAVASLLLLCAEINRMLRSLINYLERKSSR
ncbi:MAG: four helix bundle protein [Lachnoclostridium sp.]|nr:four helix bundle protein [Lachnoclostridium sp.]